MGNIPKVPAFNNPNSSFLDGLRRKTPYRYADIVTDDFFQTKHTPLNLRKLLDLQRKILQEAMRRVPETKHDDASTDPNQSKLIIHHEKSESAFVRFSDSITTEGSESVQTFTDFNNQRTRSTVTYQPINRKSAFPVIMLPLPDQIFIPMRKSKYRSRENSNFELQNPPSTTVQTNLAAQVETDGADPDVEAKEPETMRIYQKMDSDPTFPELSQYELTLDKELRNLIQTQNSIRRKLKKDGPPPSVYHQQLFGSNKQLMVASNKQHRSLKFQRDGEFSSKKKRRTHLNLPFEPTEVADQLWKMKALQWLMSDSHHNNEQHEHEDVMRDLFELALVYVPEEETFRNFYYYMNSNTQTVDQSQTEREPFQSELLPCNDTLYHDQVSKCVESEQSAMAKTSTPEKVHRPAIVYSLQPNQPKPSQPSSIKMDIIDNAITKNLALNRNRASILRKIHSTIVAKHSIDAYVNSEPNLVGEEGSSPVREPVKSNIPLLQSQVLSPHSTFIRRSSVSKMKAMDSSSTISDLPIRKTEIHNAKTLEDKIDKYLSAHKIPETLPPRDLSSVKSIPTVEVKSIPLRADSRLSKINSQSTPGAANTINEAKLSSYISKQFSEELQMQSPMFLATMPKTPKSSFNSPRRPNFKDF